MRIDPTHPLLLASGSPRRRELLDRTGAPFVVVALDVDEAVRGGEDDASYLERVVARKAEAAAAALRAHAAYLVADTVVVRPDGTLAGKPSDDEEARAILTSLSGREHGVATRFSIGRADGRVVARTVRTRVWFRELSPAHVDAYVATGEGRDKAGAYAIQGVGAMLVRRIDGSYSNVVGLPLCEVVEALEELALVGSCPIG